MISSDAVAQITQWGYPAKEVSARLGVSTHSHYAWRRKFAKTVSGDTEKNAEIRLLKRSWPMCAIDPSTMASAYFAKDAK